MESSHKTGCQFPDLAIGPIRLSPPLVQAPLSGYSDWPMRLIARRHGAPMTFCEVMLDRFLLEAKNPTKTRRNIFLCDEEHPVGGQLMGDAPEVLAAGAATLVKTGYDVIDLNFACPVKKVLGRSRGGALMGDPKTAIRMIQLTREAVPSEIPLTLKMRRGLDESNESRDKFYRIFDAAFAEGVAAVTVHGRTVQQKYTGRACLDSLADIKRHAGERVVLGSGDLMTAADCRNMLEKTGVDGLAIARGAIGNPWIYRQIEAELSGHPLPAPPDLHCQRDVLREHYALAVEIYGSYAFSLMRKVGIRYSALHPEQLKVRIAFASMKNEAELEALLSRWYAENRPGCWPA